MRLRKPSKQEALGLGIAENRFRSTYTRHDLWVSCESALDAERGRRRNFNRVTIHLLSYYWFYWSHVDLYRKSHCAATAALHPYTPAQATETLTTRMKAAHNAWSSAALPRSDHIPSSPSDM